MSLALDIKNGISIVIFIPCSNSINFLFYRYMTYGVMESNILQYYLSIQAEKFITVYNH